MSKFITVFNQTLRLLLASSLLLSSSVLWAYEAQVDVDSQAMQFSSSSQDVRYLSVQVWGPDGALVFEQTSAGTGLAWVLIDGAQDGRYKYQIKMSNVAPGSRSRSDATDSANIAVEVSSQSGSVLIESGSIIPSQNEETGFVPVLNNHNEGIVAALLNTLFSSAYADQVFLDDVVVGGSLCTGLDCVNGENFSFDTLRLKENNLRLHFSDTSSTSSFPSNDWRILINDSTNGGANMFAIEDASAGRRVFTLEAGAQADSLYVDQNGRVGFGTSNPAVTLEAVDGSTPTLRLNQDGSHGFFPQTWDLGGNETGFFVRDASNGSKLPFRIQSNAPSNALYVASSGNVGIGLDTPTEQLHVMGNAIISGNLELGSSRSIKHEINDLGLEQALQALVELEPVMFKYNHSPEDQAIGFIAEDVPDLLATESRKSLKPMDIVAVLTKVVQAQQQTIESLSQKIDGLLIEQASQ